MAALARKCQQIFVAAVFTFHTGKAVAQITAIEITIDHLLDVVPPESVLPGRWKACLNICGCVLL